MVVLMWPNLEDVFMELIVREASEAEAEFAWPLYKSFVQKNLFDGTENRKPPSAWNDAQERAKFREYWATTTRYIIEVDGVSVGWPRSKKDRTE
jgi:hypothetical protein